MSFIQLFNPYKEHHLSGRYITNKHIIPLLEKLNSNFKINNIGESVEKKKIFSVTYGTGKTKILMWSQMHGNETTTTKALFDFLNFLNSNHNEAIAIQHYFTLCIIPIANPDGAQLYTRANANNIDLNRDASQIVEPESKILRKIFETFKPDYCFNLHDQRTIFGVGNTPLPATLSFLAPSYNEAKQYNTTRLKAVHIINKINETLQEFIPGQIGRFDDSFNINCIGDYFQNQQVPTLLFEAGHYPNDYQREETRKYVFVAYLSALNAIKTSTFNNIKMEDCLNKYLNIPQNKTVFYDLIYKNITINKETLKIITNFAAQYKEILCDNTITFQAEIVQIDHLENKYGHVEYDCLNGIYLDNNTNTPIIGETVNFSLNNNTKFINGIKIDS